MKQSYIYLKDLVFFNLLNLYPIVFLFYKNYENIFLIQIFKSCSIIILTVIVLFILLKFIEKKIKINKNKIFILILFYSIVIQYYGDLHIYLYNTDYSFYFINNKLYNLGRNRYLLPIVTFTCIIISIYILIKLEVKDYVLEILKTFLMIIYLQLILSFIYKHLNKDKNYTAKYNIKYEDSSKQYPDVYYIILDAYASSYALERIYKFDNYKFLKGLNDEGFHIIEKSSSNYPYTRLSLASSLNFEYLNQDKYKYNKDLYNNIKDNSVSRKFKEKGYDYIYFNTGYGYKEAGINEIAITNSNGKNITVDNAFTKSYLESTIYSLCINLFISDELESFREKINYAFNNIENVAKKKSPKFIFLHLISPHPPYLFKENGSIQKYIAVEDIIENKKGYLEQLKFINNKIKQAIKIIKQNSKSKPIIIIQSDHGFTFDYNINKQEQEGIKERFYILNAIYAPNNIKNKLYKSMTPVNTFRIIFNSLFENKYKILKDSSFMSTEYSPYQFSDVTKILK